MLGSVQVTWPLTAVVHGSMRDGLNPREAGLVFVAANLEPGSAGSRLTWTSLESGSKGCPGAWAELMSEAQRVA